jgi:molybdenum cofactor biosynthesis enzyme MoaA
MQNRKSFAQLLKMIFITNDTAEVYHDKFLRQIKINAVLIHQTNTNDAVCFCKWIDGVKKLLRNTGNRARQTLVTYDH